jgi:hypothetical protein
MTPGVLGAGVGLDLDDAHRESSFIGIVMDEDLVEEQRRERACVALVEGAVENLSD